ncbi:hypothetical protein TrST_g9917 [Triparma strigata]|uniref:ER membrane protein complex subunit 6 n=1 Tax=Triparma strigata TaxID=1606541 RepID=A0A9W7E1Q5_9STRA|nr:hypothetical protein TrST_g9917 [Triparma strigata]
MMNQAAMDPMQGIGGPPTSSSSSTSGVGRAIFNQQISHKNTTNLSDARTYMGILLGVVSGICGLRDLRGFVFFFGGHVGVGAALMVKMEFDVKSYSAFQSATSFLLSDIQKCGMGYMLFWTLFYSLCYCF